MRTQIRWCATRPADTAANLKLLDTWQAEEQSRAQTRARIDRDLNAAKANGALSPMQHVSRMIQQQWWPYILILALSIKFGKACSGVAPDLDRMTRRLRFGVGSIASRLPRFPRQPPGSDTDEAGDPPLS